MNSYISLSQVVTDKYLIYAKDAQKYDSLSWFDEKVGSCMFVDEPPLIEQWKTWGEGGVDANQHWYCSWEAGGHPECPVGQGQVIRIVLVDGFFFRVRETDSTCAKKGRWSWTSKLREEWVMLCAAAAHCRRHCCSHHRCCFLCPWWRWGRCRCPCWTSEFPLFSGSEDFS